jgi:hypothetical protein
MVIPCIEGTVLGPQHEHRALDGLLSRVGSIVLTIYRCGCAVLFTDGMYGRWGAQRPHILSANLRGKGVGSGGPAI